MFTPSNSGSAGAVAVSKKPAVVKKSVSSENDTTPGVPKPFSSSSKGNALHKVKSGYITKKPSKITAEKQQQTDNPDDALVTGDTPTLEYWKLLAEEREKGIAELQREKVELEEKNEALVTENEDLKNQNNLLQQENETIEAMLEDAKRMAEYFQSVPDGSDEDEDE